MARSDLFFRIRGWIGCAVLIPTAFISLFSPPVLGEGSWGAWVTDVAGFGAFICGAALRFWATFYIGGRKGVCVVREGPYSICRNPIYLGSFLIGVSLVLFLKTMWLAYGVGFMVAFYVWATIPVEESRLREQLGCDYIKYCREVPRFFPDFSHFISGPTVLLDIHALKSEVKRALWWMWLPFCSLTASRLRAEPWWPWLF